MVDAQGICLLCHFAMYQHYWTAGQDVFMEEHPAAEMLWVVAGKLEYYIGQGDRGFQHVVVGQPLCEAVLWTNWVHRGRLVASTSCELFGLNAEKFRDITPKRGLSFQYLRQYANLFVRNVLGQDFKRNMTDICEEIDALQLVSQAFEVDPSSPPTKSGRRWRSGSSQTGN
eukprot:gnl/TRDRNA2_/TRDRNA2_74995_c0_seq1.p1 gnl/TRDRNA2_/TRDRNA2_74995_c0~~gnl/TRDRNA2_/TRDRNA2_74995_c0_seq1.p1  ORF type:complete len:191 (-),score=23.35 gnl/TRDRNA2_/TRDRNA2_74995_c0_seq1:27-539(-)